MSEKIEAPTPWPFAPGQIVRDSGEGDDTAWLECAPEGTVLRLPDTTEVTMRHGLTYCWRSDDDSVYTSVGLAAETDGPLTVVSVPDCCDHLDMDQGHCYACYDSGHAHDPERPCPPAAGGAEATGAVERATKTRQEFLRGTPYRPEEYELAARSNTEVAAMRAALAAALDAVDWPDTIAGHMTITLTDMHRCACHAPLAPSIDRYMAEQAHLAHLSAIIRAALLGGAA